MSGRRSPQRGVSRALVASLVVGAFGSVLTTAHGYAGSGPDPLPSQAETPVLTGDVWLTEGQLSAMRERVAQGVEPAASAADALFEEARTDMVREPEVPDVWFVPSFYNDPDAHRAAKDPFLMDVNASYRLALAYHLTGDQGYAEKATEFIAAWSTGVREFRTTQDSSLVFSYHVPAMIGAASLLRGTEAWSDGLEADFDAFLDHTVPLLNTMDRENNWGNWGMLFVMSAAAYQRDELAFHRAVARWQELLASQVDEQGHLHLEVTRNNGTGTHGVWYSHFSLQPQTAAAEIAAVNGIDLYGYESPNGRTLEMAVREVAGWVEDPETFPYLQGSRLVNVREITGYVDRGIPASTITYFELTQARWNDPAAAGVLGEERPVTTVHSIPHLSLTHGGLTCQPGESVCGQSRPVDLARGKPVEVSSVYRPGYEGPNAVDGGFSDDSRWVSAVEGDPEPWIEIDLGEPADIGAVRIYTGIAGWDYAPWTVLKDFTVEGRTDAGGWQQIAQITDNDDHVIPLADLNVTVDALRLLITRPGADPGGVDAARIHEIQIYDADGA